MDEKLDLRQEADALAELVKFDYERTTAFIQGVVSVSANLRTIAIGGWFALVAASIDTGTWELALIALGAVLLFGLLDGYHGWLYAQALGRATAMEAALQAYAKWIRRPSDQDVMTKAVAALRAHRFGQLRNTPTLTLSGLSEARPAWVYRGLYPALTIGAGIVGLGVSELCLG